MSKASLIVSVYNKARELSFIFETLLIQSFKDFEVIISEDGNTLKIRDCVEKYRNILPNKIIHLTQEDKGFRKNIMLNEAIRSAGTDYLIFIDGDCLPHSDFIEAHVENRENNTVLCGRRVALGEELSKSITKDKILSKEYEKLGLKHFLNTLGKTEGKSKHMEEGVIVKNKFIRDKFLDKDTHILGCNFSIEKNLLEKINGFDENYLGPGLGEDSDIEFRLRLTGAKFKSVRNLAIQYHIYHGKTIEAAENFGYFQKVKEEANYLCKNGLKKL